MSKMEYFLLHQHYELDHILCSVLQATSESGGESESSSTPLIPPIVAMYSDGWPDHSSCHSSVKLAFIYLIRKLKLDMLIAMRTAPGNSFVNPVETIMSTLNLGLQSVALERKSAGKYETKLRACHSISDIRSASKGWRMPSLRVYSRHLLKYVINLFDSNWEKTQGLATTATSQQLEKEISYLECES